MPEYSVEVSRDYVQRESAAFVVNAPSPEAALAKARELELDGEVETDWTEDDGGADASSYTWEIRDADGTLLFEDEGPGEE
jgi:hypothetical protein